MTQIEFSRNPKTRDELIINDHRVERSIMTTDGEAFLHVTSDGKIWLDCGGISLALVGPREATYSSAWTDDEILAEANE